MPSEPSQKDNNSQEISFIDQWERDISLLVAADSDTKREAEDIAAGMEVDLYNSLRINAKTDLFFLCYTILGFDRLSPNLHGNLCGWMHDTQDKRFREILLPRGHFKSTVATIGHSLQLALPDVGENSPYPANLGTDIRLVIAHEAREQAMRFLFAITSHFLGNKLLRALFPEAIPDPRKQKINQSELELPRTKSWPEPTIDTMGTGARGQGRHYNYLKLDDLIGMEARDSETVMKSAIQWFNNIQSFFSNFKVDHFDLIGTRWKMNDLYHHAHNMYGDALIRYIRPVLEFNSDGEKVAIFPEEFDEETLAILRKDPIVWTAQYLNDPSEGAAEFLPEWKRYFTYGKTRREVIVLRGSEEVDQDNLGNGVINSRVINPYLTLHSPLTAPELVRVEDLDIVILIDPAMTGESGFLVTGMDKNRRVFIFEAIKKPLRTPEFVELLFQKVRYWNPRTVVIEEVLFSGLYGEFLPREMILRGLKFHISLCRTKNQEKDARVRQLTNYFSAGQIYAHPELEDFWNEYDYFGTGAKYHLLDALAQGPKYWQPGNMMKKLEEVQVAERERLKGRSNITGYSKI